MRHGSQGTRAALVSRGREQGPVELSDLECSIWVCVLLLVPEGLQLLAELFPDLNEEYNDWHLTSIDPLSQLLSSEAPHSLWMFQAALAPAWSSRACLRQGGDLHGSRGGRG